MASSFLSISRSRLVISSWSHSFSLSSLDDDYWSSGIIFVVYCSMNLFYLSTKLAARDRKSESGLVYGGTPMERFREVKRVIVWLSELVFFFGELLSERFWVGDYRLALIWPCFDCGRFASFIAENLFLVRVAALLGEAIKFYGLF
jgi:hypothetical protein